VTGEPARDGTAGWLGGGCARGHACEGENRPPTEALREMNDALWVVQWPNWHRAREGLGQRERRGRRGRARGKWPRPSVIWPGWRVDMGRGPSGCSWRGWHRHTLRRHTPRHCSFALPSSGRCLSRFRCSLEAASLCVGAPPANSLCQTPVRPSETVTLDTLDTLDIDISRFLYPISFNPSICRNA
jgi:hypothetical protein